MKIGLMDIDQKWIYLGSVIIIILIIFAFLSWPKKQPVTTIPAINAAQQTIEKQLNKQITDKDTVIKSKEGVIKDLQNRLTLSDKKYKSIVDKFIVLQKEKENVKTPITVKELRDRFVTAGFIPLPDGQCGSGTICFSTSFK